MERDTRNCLLLGYTVMQHFYGEDWDKDIEELGLENEED